MAPMDQLRQPTLEELRRRHVPIDEARLRRRDGDGKGNGNGKGSGGKRDGGEDDSSGGGGGGSGGGDGGGGNGNGGNSDSNDNGDGGKSNNGKNGSGNNNQKPKSSPQVAEAPPSPPPPSFPLSAATSATPTTIVLISTTTAPPQVSTTTAIAVPAAASLSSSTSISTFFPATTPIATTTPFPLLPSSAFSDPPPSSSQPRKGVSDDPDFPPPTKSPKTVTATATTSMWLIPESIVASPTPTSSGNSSKGSSNHHNNDNGKHNNPNLTPTAQHLLIAAGAIGAFIMVIAGLYFLTRMRKIDLLAYFRDRTFRKGGARGWYGWRRREEDYTSDPPPKYSGEEYPYEKSIPTQQTVDAFYKPTAVPKMATPASSANALERSDSGRQDMVREALLDNPEPFATTAAPQPAVLSATENFYGVAAQPTSLSRLPGTQSTTVSQPNSNYNNTGTQNTFLTMRTQDAYDPNQREPNHLSYLSSLSSGFGDGLIMPEPTVVGAGRQSYRQSKAPGTGRFSWMTSNRGTMAGPPAPYGDRDTVYTTASIESAPRFRTVNSWVAQQAGRVERQQQSDQEVPAMPPIPAPLQAQNTGAGSDHRRNPSENPAFKAHPGDEIEIGRGSRVPSSILDRKIGIN
ncbi:uncharacterized protein PAC_07050 [Phialocephala subalpina]|uniref:Uncharacterized protein n=1 Tax=Phialocephala subalpina TaxID=576137 RepID=A0A1L7WWL6_9HELO|nr:uncharacterized protein PAC_07050 [Phialocephala subalpina]